MGAVGKSIAWQCRGREQHSSHGRHSKALQQVFFGVGIGHGIRLSSSVRSTVGEHALKVGEKQALYQLRVRHVRGLSVTSAS
jgi:hypothetical protein